MNSDVDIRTAGNRTSYHNVNRWSAGEPMTTKTATLILIVIQVLSLALLGMAIFLAAR